MGKVGCEKMIEVGIFVLCARCVVISSASASMTAVVFY